jgi:DNA-binding SARP family transcriptional activator
VSFGLIGPLDVRYSGHSIAVPAARQRSLLAALLLRANQPVTRQSLCAAVWGDSTSDGAETTLRSYIMRLRRVLGPALAARLSAQPAGYQLRLEEDDELDLLQLQGCVRRGRTAARERDWDRSLREFRAGLTLWRGEPLCDVPSDYLQLSVRPALSELRVQLWEGLYAGVVERGRAADCVVPLQRLTEEEPLSERFCALFMSALAGCGRRVDALAEYRRLRKALISEQGVEPGARLQELHQQLLCDDQALAALVPAPRAPAVMTSAVPVPRQLPRGAAVFTGRDRELGELVRGLSAGPDDAAAHPVVAITGFPGIGKSELAINLAHRVADCYPDGQLYADLGGSLAVPAEPGAVLTRFLHALGLDRRAVARDETERIGQYRSLLAGRRLLLVLDDARDADQVRPLIPGSRSCGTVVTGRRGLAQLAEAHLTTLAGLPDAAARDLLRAMAATDRADAEPAAVSSIVAACGGVPLALSIAGARLAARPSWPLDQFAALLAAERGRLDELCYGRLSLRARLTATYRSLADSGHYPDQAAARALRLLGSWPVAAISTAQAAVLLGASPAEAAEALETLADASLLASPAPGQYLLHPLTRAFAADQAAPVPRLLRSSWGGDQARRGTCELPSSGAGVAWPWRAWRDVTPAGPAATVAVVGLLRPPAAAGHRHATPGGPC